MPCPTLYFHFLWIPQQGMCLISGSLLFSSMKPFQVNSGLILLFSAPPTQTVMHISGTVHTKRSDVCKDSPIPGPQKVFHKLRLLILP